MSVVTECPSIDVTVQDTEVVVTGSGELDLRVATQFDAAVESAIAAGLPVTIDLCRAVFIDSAILQSVARCGRAMFDRNQRLRLMITRGTHTEYVLETVGFGAFIDIDKDCDAKRA